MLPKICASSFLDYTVLGLSGEFDVVARPMLAAARRTAMAVPSGRLVLDLSGVTFLDCSTLREIATIVECVAPGTAVVCPEGIVLRLLRMTGFLDAHRVVPTLVEATMPSDPELLGSA